VTRECHAGICGSPGVRFPRATRPHRNLAGNPVQHQRADLRPVPHPLRPPPPPASPAAAPKTRPRWRRGTRETVTIPSGGGRSQKRHQAPRSPHREPRHPPQSRTPRPSPPRRPAGTCGEPVENMRKWRVKTPGWRPGIPAADPGSSMSRLARSAAHVYLRPLGWRFGPYSSQILSMSISEALSRSSLSALSEYLRCR
jgi:hypothetical protein